jgi:two-component system response regulator AtoC
VPPLRRRREDIAPLVMHFLEVYGKGKPPLSITEAAMQQLTRYSWPGNVRELQNIIERAVVMTDNNIIDVADLPLEVAGPNEQFGLLIPEDQISIKQTLSELDPRVEKELIRRALQKTNNNRTRAARLLEISHRSLLYKLKEYNCG